MEKKIEATLLFRVIGGKIGNNNENYSTIQGLGLMKLGFRL